LAPCQIQSDGGAHHPGDGWQMTGQTLAPYAGFERAQRLAPKGRHRTAEQSLAERPAGAIGNVVRHRRIVPAVPFREACRLAMDRADERKAGMATLVQAVGQVVLQSLATTHFAELPCGFQTTGVREATGGKGGVGELEELPQSDVRCPMSDV